MYDYDKIINNKKYYIFIYQGHAKRMIGDSK